MAAGGGQRWLAEGRRLAGGGAFSSTRCGAAASYLGESGRRDALEGLMLVLRQRLGAPPAPPEPWAGAASFAEAAAAAAPLPPSYFRRRHAWYARLLGATSPLALLEAARAHRRACCGKLSGLWASAGNIGCGPRWFTFGRM